ncbi:MAG: ribose-phosphate pyrophosphokinase [Acidobacteria bacterium]|nr:ribose-phosphate pyrophosphokinase [Acidobacteriota bacterium]MCG2816771.1 ribose-phosphate pyrophosphokinase [Candidatus Aminicenantes bacterium]MBU1338754.1 ribose-phosphate pyrophosphokinase [Acidobacteriota bacterium]MBU1474469.1 ribose-phosphate pyrophosphokinase [Acidobacteriota bacterium]MBU2439304.1 ribose-phosphate pyrophosphokinase [Acidobacteriota bacterium]
MKDKTSLKVFSGSSNRALAEEIVDYLGLSLGACNLDRFSDGEIHFYIDENVRGEDVFVVQSGSTDANYHMMELFLMLDAFKRASAEHITAVIPYYSYARQDWKDRPRVPISARLMADLLEAAGANRVLTMDLHSPQIQGFFSFPVDNLVASPVLAGYVQKLKLKRLTVVSPDAGGVGRAKWFARRMDAELAIIDKRRPTPNVARVFNVIGNVSDRDVVILDDMVDTGGTLVQSVEALKKKGAKRIFAACTHGLLSGEAVSKIQKSSLEALIITNTIPQEKQLEKIVVLSVAELFGEAIKRINQGSSVSSLFE